MILQLMDSDARINFDHFINHKVDVEYRMCCVRKGDIYKCKCQKIESHDVDILLQQFCYFISQQTWILIDLH